ncbi:MAG: M20/M25/M40 family metallo-hydrolase, partial [Oceanococcus sp.]
ITRLIDQGFQPQQTLYFAFGHDEEIGGLKGAAVMAKALAKRDVELSFVLDEGGIISEGVVAGVERPVATLMTAEKGFASYRLNVTDAGGHSSMPPPLTAVGRIARAVARLDQQPMPARLTNPVTDMLDQLAPAMPFPQRLAIANRWLLETALLKALARTPATNAMTRTTTAATMLSGGVKDNVLPNAAEAVVNFRLLPGDSLETLENHIRNSIADSAVQITQVGDWANVASKVSSSNSVTFAVLQQSVIAVFPKAITVPGLVVGATDARHYADISKDRYNFLPIRLSAEDIERIHGIDERISVQGYADMVRFYIQFLQNLNHIR